jgi:AraC-like DNA-binding protein
MSRTSNVNLSAIEEVERRINLAKTFIENNYILDIQLPDIAAAAHLSPTHLNRLFKQKINTTPYQYLVNVRLKQATALLEQTKIPVREIVAQVGFYSPSSFIRLFKKKHCVTPSIFRQTSCGPTGVRSKSRES